MHPRRHRGLCARAVVCVLLPAAACGRSPRPAAPIAPAPAELTALVQWDGELIRCPSTSTALPIGRDWRGRVQRVGPGSIVIASPASPPPSAMVVTAGSDAAPLDAMLEDWRAAHRLVAGPIDGDVQARGGVQLARHELNLRYHAGAAAGATSEFELRYQRIARNGASCRITVVRRVAVDPSEDPGQLLAGVATLDSLDFERKFPTPGPDGWETVRWMAGALASLLARPR